MVIARVPCVTCNEGVSGIVDMSTSAAAPADVVRRGRGSVVVSSTASDSHTWNLVYLQLLIEETGLRVVNLGACVPVTSLVARCREIMPDLVVISSVNGHGGTDGLHIARSLRACVELAAVPLVIGGKLDTGGASGAGIRGELLAAGFDAVFGDRDAAAFQRFLSTIAAKAAP